MEFETLLTDLMFLEAPRAGPDGAIWFSDVLLGGVYRLADDGKTDRYLEDRRSIGGLAFNQDGALICSGSDGLIHFDPGSGESRNYDLVFDGSDLRSINDIQPDDAGGIYVGSVDFASVSKGQRPQAGGLFRLDPSGPLDRLSADDIVVSNGIDLSPDRTRLYHADSRIGIYAFDIDDTGRPANRKMLVEGRGPDGLVVDSQGCIWVANYMTGDLVQFDADGREMFKLHFPDVFPDVKVTSLTFAGADLRDLVIVTAGDYLKPAEKKGGVYRTRVDVPGQVLPTARLPRPPLR